MTIFIALLMSFNCIHTKFIVKNFDTGEGKKNRLAGAAKYDLIYSSPIHTIVRLSSTIDLHKFTHYVNLIPNSTLSSMLFIEYS